MSKSPISEVLIDATRLLEAGELTRYERQAICETVMDLIGRETSLCNSSAQRQWLIAKAWATAVGVTSTQGRSFGPRSRVSWDRIRAILAEVPKRE
jgi:hypothetical protein